MLSVIIPAYNSRPYIGRLLKSIAKQKYNDLEVVIADDCSPEPYDDVVDAFRDTLNIVRTSTKYNCCPGNTRQAGVDAASGDWYTFADHDDAYYPNVFREVDKAIKQDDPKVVVTDFVEVDPKTDAVLFRHSQSFGWTHGKFYNAEWWKKHGLHYKKDLKSHEDIYLSTTVDCALHADGIKACYLPIISYKWTAHPESLSRREDKLFIETHMSEYIQATGYAFLEDYQKRKDLGYSLYHALSVVMYCYFYHQGIAFFMQGNGSKDTAVYVRDYIRDVKKAFDMTTEDIVRYCTRDHGQYFWDVQENAKIATGPYMPFLTFQQYLTILESDDGN